MPASPAGHAGVGLRVPAVRVSAEPWGCPPPCYPRRSCSHTRARSQARRRLAPRRPGTTVCER